MDFRSILFDNNQSITEVLEAPPFFTDLNLDQIIGTIVRGKQDYNLKPFFYAPLHDIETILYRQEIMRDLEDEYLLSVIHAFAEKMVVLRRYLSMIEKLDYKYHIEGWFLEAASVYCEAINTLAQGLNAANIQSRGLLGFREYLNHYVATEYYNVLQSDIQQNKSSLSTITYCIIIKGDLVKVRKYNSEIDYSIDVLATFERFKQREAKDYRLKLFEGVGMNHIEAKILEFVARLFPDIFLSLDQFYTQHANFLDQTINTFDREIEFYVAYLEYIAPIKKTGLRFCYPQISTASKDVYCYEGFDLALAHKLMKENGQTVWNDFTLKDPERILIISGPNQGGKTTFARTFGQLHYLASLGCPVPGREARLFLYDNIYTHFEKEEDIRNLRGKLQDDLVRIYNILERASPDSILILNEIFTSTTSQDAAFLSKKVIDRIIQLDLLCVWVTFVDELSTISNKTVSMVSTVVPENPTIRTFKILRKPADGLAYALSIAEKYHLTREHVKRRIRA